MAGFPAAMPDRRLAALLDAALALLCDPAFALLLRAQRRSRWRDIGLVLPCAGAVLAALGSIDLRPIPARPTERMAWVLPVLLCAIGIAPAATVCSRSHGRLRYR